MLLEAKNLHKKFAQRPAIQDISLQLRAGEVLGIIGESGCGKSTLARLLTGLQKADRGEILFEGRSPQNLTRQERARFIQIMFQDSAAALHPRLRIGAALREVLQSVCTYDAAAAAEELRVALPKLDLPEEILERYPHQLSGGQKQRVCLLRALLLKPKVLVCDEPVTALDRMTQARVLQLLQNLRSEFGFAIIFISHDISSVRTLADHVAVMYAGQWMEYGPAQDVLNIPRHPYTHYLLQSLPKLYRGAETRRIPDFQEASAHEPLEGCPLVLRCPFAEEACRRMRPASGQPHHVACVKAGVF
jgi:oligopeptide/dipeptide ABC transporter ATP-binding protein